MAERIFKTPFEQLKVDESKAARCPVCGEPLWKHSEPDFVCKPPAGTLPRAIERQAVCPVCGLKFQARLPTLAPAGAEVDTDFCRHPVGRDVVVGSVWLCMRCGYAAHYERFNKPVDAATRQFALNELKSRTLADIRALLRLPEKDTADLTFLAQLDVPDVLKYRNAAMLLERAAPSTDSTGRGPVERARFYMEAAHAARRAVNARIEAAFLTGGLLLVDRALASDMPGAQLPLAARVERLEQALAAGSIAGRQMQPDTEYCVNLVLAGLHDRQGDAAQAAACLRSAQATIPLIPGLTPTKSSLLAADVARRLGYLEAEAAFANSAVAALLAGMSGGAVAEPAAFLAYGYLVAEYHRRLGAFGKARAWFEILLPLAAKADPTLADWIDEALASNALQRPPDTAEAETVAAMYKRAGADEVAPLAPLHAVPEAASDNRLIQEPAAAPAAAEPTTSCRQYLENFYQAADAFRQRFQRWPLSLDELRNERLLPPYMADELRCPETGVQLFYRPPRTKADFILYHKNPTQCKCPLILYSDGTIGSLPKPTAE